MKKFNYKTLILSFFLFLFISGATKAIVVHNTTQLVNAVNNANSGGDKEILLADGTYTLNNQLQIQSTGITVRSLSGIRDRVFIKGQGMYGGVSHIFDVYASYFFARDMTIGWVCNHAVQIHGELNASNTLLSNLRIADAYEQLVKISYNSSSSNTSSNGIMENCLLEYTAGIGPQYYIGGIDGHQTTNWIVRDNIFKYIISPGGDIAEHAIHFWSDSINTLVENNLIINCDRGIGFGLGSRGHINGIIRNNMIYHNSNNYNFADVGIILENASNAQVYNNTVFMEHSHPNAIEYRWSGTSGGIIANNLTNKSIISRDGGSATLYDNIQTATAGWFKNPSSHDLHLKYAVSAVIDQGSSISGLTLDYDRDPRPQGSSIDIGADEYKIWSSPYRLTWNSGNSIKPRIISDSGGVLHTFWHDGSTGDMEIMYKRNSSTNSGTSWSTPSRLTWNSGDSKAPQAVVDSSDNLHLVWKEASPGNGEIFYKKSSTSGVSWSAPTRLCWNTGASIKPKIVRDNSDNLHVFWQDGSWGNDEILYKRSTDSGASWSESTRLTWNSGHSQAPAGVADSGVNLFLFWADFTPGNAEIFFKQSTDNGNSWSAPRRITWNTGNSENPAAVVDTNDHLYLVWEDLSPGNREVYYKKSTDNGNSWTTAIRMTWNSGDSRAPVIVSDPNFNLHLAWSDSSPGNYEVYYKRSKNQGSTWSNIQRLTWKAGDSLTLSLAVDPNKDTHLVWSEYIPGSFEIFYKKR